MATAWYKPHAIPRVLRAFPAHGGAASPSPSVEVWSTTCIVRNFGKEKAPQCSVLINPSNPSLTGVYKFPYFPRGGPTRQPLKDAHHIMAYVSQWGGMEVKDGMLFAGNVVDGIVHELGGWRLRIQCMMQQNVEVGKAASTGPGGSRLGREYDQIIHTVPPFYNHHEEPEQYLTECYQNALSLAFSSTGSTSGDRRVACPLIGAGGRGFPTDVAIRIAARESIQWRDAYGRTDDTLAFGIPDETVATSLIEAIEQEYLKQMTWEG